MAASSGPSIGPLSEDAVLITFGNTIDPDLSAVIRAWCDAIPGVLAGMLTDLVPSYTSITVYYDPVKADFRQVIHRLRSVPEHITTGPRHNAGREVELPVWYHPAVGPDLEPLARACDLTVEQVIERHTAGRYQVYALGFSPGFGFMGLVDESIAQPRLERPRVKVPAGSVGIANRQTAVYPAASPGGWRVIGRCPTRLFSEDDLALLSAGDTVRFRAIDRDTFRALGGDDAPFEEGHT